MICRQAKQKRRTIRTCYFGQRSWNWASSQLMYLLSFMLSGSLHCLLVLRSLLQSSGSSLRQWRKHCRWELRNHQLGLLWTGHIPYCHQGLLWNDKKLIRIRINTRLHSWHFCNQFILLIFDLFYTIWMVGLLTSPWIYTL